MSPDPNFVPIFSVAILVYVGNVHGAIEAYSRTRTKRLAWAKETNLKMLILLPLEWSARQQPSSIENLSIPFGHSELLPPSLLLLPYLPLPCLPECTFLAKIRAGTSPVAPGNKPRANTQGLKFNDVPD